jgi:hypothetical protein
VEGRGVPGGGAGLYGWSCCSRTLGLYNGLWCTWNVAASVSQRRLLLARPSLLQDRAAKQAQAASDAARTAVSARLDHWLAPGIVVKVLAKKLTGYYKQKGVVLRVLDKYRGEIEMIESGDVLQVGGWVRGWVRGWVGGWVGSRA